MLKLSLGQIESLDESTNRFVLSDPVAVIELEHSLVSLSKWESKWEKPFMGDNKKTDEQMLDYIRDMTLTPDVPEKHFALLGEREVKKISDYIHAKHTATWFTERPGAPAQAKETITAEIVYYWMIAHNIPVEFETWHLNRLLTLIRVCNEKNDQGKNKKKTPRADLAAQRRALNAQRKAESGTAG